MRESKMRERDVFAVEGTHQIKQTDRIDAMKTEKKYEFAGKYSFIFFELLLCSFMQNIFKWANNNKKKSHLP